MEIMMHPLIINFIYAAGGGLMAIAFSWFAVKVFSHFMPFSVSEQLGKGNLAVGVTVMGIFIGVGIAMGLVIGMGLN